MKLLIDTHTFIWFVDGSSALSPFAKQLLEDKNNDIYLSLVSVWELATKISIGKLAFAQPLPEYVTTQTKRNGIALLPIELPHVLYVATMPLHHRDPFDRLLVAQSEVERLPLVSADAVLDGYGVQRLW